MLEKIKTDVERRLLVLIMEKTISIDFDEIDLFYFLYKSFFIYVRFFSSTISQILKTIFYIIWT